MKKLPFFIALFLMILIVVYTPFAKRSIAKGNNETGNKPCYNSIIDVWELDMVEGGIGSRKDFLLKTAKIFEKKNSGVIVSVSVQTKNSAEEKFKNGIYPDVISFSNGLNGFTNCIKKLSLSDSLGGKINKETFAKAWAVGGYAFIKHKSTDLKMAKCLVSQADFTQPLISYYLSEYRFNEVEVCPPKNAYSKFVSAKNSVLIGTQRDVHRLLSRNAEFEVFYVSNFTDIVQYVSITSTNVEKKELSNDFVNFLCGEMQSEVKSIGMLSNEYQNCFDGDNAIFFDGFKPTKTLSLFTSPEVLSETQNYLADFKVSEQEKLNRIKNIVQ